MLGLVRWLHFFSPSLEGLEREKDGMGEVERLKLKQRKLK